MEKLNTALAQLGLSPKQKSQITQILADAKSSLSSRKSGVTTGATTGAGKSKGRQFMQKIMGVLTAPQQAKLKQILKAERSKAAKA